VRCDISVELLCHTPDPERVVATAAKACWTDKPIRRIAEDLTDAEIARLLPKVILRGHHSVLEHINFTFAIEGVSRVLSHQLVRHRMGSYSQLSQQRHDESDFAYVVPPAILHDDDLLKGYRRCMGEARDFYMLLLTRGVPKGTARYLLPAACRTRVVVTMNARSLFGLLEQRLCGAEEWEFRLVAAKMQRELMNVAPRIFRFAGPKCETERVCPEGDVADECAHLLRIRGATVANRDCQLSVIAGS
jgi:thymidylate synthase (FAD)